MALYEYQERVRDLMLNGRSIILQAPTGAGKTVAALTPFLDTFWDAPAAAFPKKCLYIVPMRVLANQFSEELREHAARYRRVQRRALGVGRQTGEYREDPELRQDLTFATIDQVLSSWLMHPYSLSAGQGNLNAGALVGSYLILDEFHLFDPDSTLPTTLQMLKTLRGVSPFLLMTATFSGAMLGELAEELDAAVVTLDEEALRGIPSQRKQRTFHTVEQPLAGAEGVFVEQIVAAHLAQPGEQRSLVVCNQVERAQRVYEALREHPALGAEHVCLLHGRFLPADRQEREAFLRAEFHKEPARHSRPSLILVATQVVEVGLDISSGALHTELAPAAAVLQRAGRCARYEGQTGQVYVYHVEPDKLHPYHGPEAQQQCARTWAWLQAHEGQPLDFSREQALIDVAHTPTDRKLLAGLRGTALEHRARIHSLWRGEGTRAEAAALIRQIQGVTVLVHGRPQLLCEAPFAAQGFTLYPGTLRGKFAAWQEANDARDPEWDEGHLPWLVQKLVETQDEGGAQANRPPRYAFTPVRSAHELSAPLLALHPDLVGYSPELGLMLYTPAPRYECPVPRARTAARAAYHYRLESYARHIELVQQVYGAEWRAWLAAVGARLEAAYGWPPGLVAAMGERVIALHDVGKLSEGWQGWARAWQTGVGRPLSPGLAAAHTDYDPTDAAQQALDRRLRRSRPSHAVESAYAAAPVLLALLPDKEQQRPLFRAAFTAISRHHGAFTAQPGSYRLIDEWAAQVAQTTAALPAPPPDVGTMWAALAYDDKAQRGLERSFFIQVQNEQDVLCYMALVRALRFADQGGTQLGSR